MRVPAKRVIDVIKKIVEYTKMKNHLQKHWTCG